MRKTIILALIISCGFTAFFINCAKAEEYSENSILIKLEHKYQEKGLTNILTRGNFLFSSLDKLNTNYQARNIEALTQNQSSSLFGVYKITFENSQNIQKIIRGYQNNEFIKYAEPNYILKIDASAPNDTNFSSQWNFDPRF